MWTDIIQDAKPSQIEGKVFVTTISDVKIRNKWVAHSDHYYVDRWVKKTTSKLEGVSPEPLGDKNIDQCIQCMKARDEDVLQRRRLLDQSGPLLGLELFAGVLLYSFECINISSDHYCTGAGGLSTGLELTGFVKTKWAVELSPSAAQTFA